MIKIRHLLCFRRVIFAILISYIRKFVIIRGYFRKFPLNQRQVVVRERDTSDGCSEKISIGASRVFSLAITSIIQLE